MKANTVNLADTVELPTVGWYNAVIPAGQHKHHFSTQELLTMNLDTCNACRYTCPADTLSDRCPDCGKATANVKVCIGGKNILRSVPAIRESTDTEVAEYERIKKEIEKL